LLNRHPMSMHTKMTMGQAHARRRSQSEGIRFIICFGRQSNKPPSGLADNGLHQNARLDSGSTHVVCRLTRRHCHDPRGYCSGAEVEPRRTAAAFLAAAIGLC
jgi:hypothetical protein